MARSETGGNQEPELPPGLPHEWQGPIRSEVEQSGHEVAWSAVPQCWPQFQSCLKGSSCALSATEFPAHSYDGQLVLPHPNVWQLLGVCSYHFLSLESTAVSICYSHPQVVVRRDCDTRWETPSSSAEYEILLIPRLTGADAFNILLHLQSLPKSATRWRIRVGSRLFMPLPQVPF